MTWLTISKAAKRARRSVRTIERWIAGEHLDVLEVKNDSGTVIQRYVDETQLLTVLRTKIMSNPTRPRDPDDVIPT